jgi:hypothetical protein
MTKTPAELKASYEAEAQEKLEQTKAATLAEVEADEELPEELKREIAELVATATVQDLNPMQRSVFSSSFLKRLEALYVARGF